MSFDANPYRVMEIATSEDGEFASWRCSSCGGGWKSSFPINTPVRLIREDFDRHVWDDHRLTREDVKDWYAP